MREALVLGVVALLVACRHSPPRQIVGPDGQKWYPIDCSGDRSDCMEEAGRLCPGGYQTQDMGSDKAVTAMPINGVMYAESSTTYKMLVKCGAAAKAD